MAELPLAQGINRFKQNEDRFDLFTNGTDTQEITHSGGEKSPTLRKFLKDKSAEVDMHMSDLIIAKDQSVAARNQSVAARDKAIEMRNDAIAASNKLYNYDRLAQANAAIDSIPENAGVTILEDGDNNGFYVKQGGILVKKSNRTIAGFGEYGVTGLTVDSFDDISMDGVYRGYNAVGTPVENHQTVVHHMTGVGGRKWQMAFVQNTSSSVPPRVFYRYGTAGGTWYLGWTEAKTSANTGEYGVGAKLVDNFDTITVDGTYRGYNAVGTPVVDRQAVIQHFTGNGGRKWQMALVQHVSASTQPKVFYRYGSTDGGFPYGWFEAKTTLNTGEYGVTGKVSDNFNTISVDGTYQGYNAVGAPKENFRTVVQQFTDSAGRKWQTAYTQQTDAGVPSHVYHRYGSPTGDWFSEWHSFKDSNNTGEYGLTATTTEDFDAIEKDGTYRGYNAVGTPVVDRQAVIQHFTGNGGRKWQMAFTQQTDTGEPSRVYHRYGSTTGDWFSEWSEFAMYKDVQTALHPSAGHPIYLFMDGSHGSIYDFTDKRSFSVEKTTEGFSQVRDITNESYLYVPTANTAPKLTLDKGKLIIKSTVVTDILTTPVNKPLLPLTGEFVLAWSHRIDTTGAKACLWQQLVGAEGRTQITANVVLNAAGGTTTTNGYLNIFIGGVTGGTGANGNIKAIPHPIGEWADFVLVIRDGAQKSAIYRNGVLIDEFTRPTSFPNVQTTLLRNTGQPGEGQSLGRLLCLNRAPQDGEIDLIRAWIRESFTLAANQDVADKWKEPVITSASAAIRTHNKNGQPDAVLWDKDGYTPRRPGSTTKLMSAYVGLKWLKQLNRMDLVITRIAADTAAGSGQNINVGDSLDVDNALANIGLVSSNVTCNVWAREIGDLILASEGQTGDGWARFMQSMNDESVVLGLTGSTWKNPHGLDETGHMSTPVDLCIIGKAIVDEHTDMRDIWSLPSWDLVITGVNPRTLPIVNAMTSIKDGNPRVIWGKTGTTPGAGSCLMSETKGPYGNTYFYAAFAATSDAARYSDAETVYDSADNGVAWPVIVPTLK